ncbi:MAG: hypothetical protein KAG80_09375 [Nocardioides sp.]|nr:hypothetical protein [Nocardioides sp.]
MSRRVLARPLVAATVASALVLTAPVAALAGDQGNGKGNGKPGTSTAQADKPGKKSNGKSQDKGKGQSNGKSQTKGKSQSNGSSNTKGKSQSKGKASGQSNGKAEGNSNGSSKGKATGKATGKAKQDPAGNNGTVKIAPYGAIDRIPNNTPHPGCTFQVEWYGFDEGDDVVSQVSFAMQAPTSDVALSVDGPTEVFVGGDSATGAGTETGLDGRETYTLSFDGEPHPKQGYHVKLTVATPRSQGNDTKTKVFWVEDCEPGTATEDSSTDTDDEGAGEDGDDSAVAGSSYETGADEGEGSSAETGEDGAVMGTTLSLDGSDTAGTTGDDGSAVPTGVDAGAEGTALERAGDLARSPWALLVLGLGLAAGAAAVVTRRAGR